MCSLTLWPHSPLPPSPSPPPPFPPPPTPSPPSPSPNPPSPRCWELFLAGIQALLAQSWGSRKDKRENFSLFIIKLIRFWLALRLFLIPHKFTAKINSNLNRLFYILGCVSIQHVDLNAYKWWRYSKSTIQVFLNRSCQCCRLMHVIYYLMSLCLQLDQTWLQHEQCSVVWSNYHAYTFQSITTCYQ